MISYRPGSRKEKPDISAYYFTEKGWFILRRYKNTL
jgi:hypothetical protein